MTSQGRQDRLAVDEISWVSEPEAPATFDTVENLAVEALGDAETYRELLSEGLVLLHREHRTAERRDNTIRTLRDELRILREAAARAPA